MDAEKKVNLIETILLQSRIDFIYLRKLFSDWYTKLVLKSFTP